MPQFNIVFSLNFPSNLTQIHVKSRQRLASDCFQSQNLKKKGHFFLTFFLNAHCTAHCAQDQNNPKYFHVDALKITPLDLSYFLNIYEILEHTHLKHAIIRELLEMRTCVKEERALLKLSRAQAKFYRRAILSKKILSFLLY